MAKQATNADSGIRDHRVEFVRETSPGETPADPAWEYFSDTLETALVWEADAQYESQRGVGHYDVQAQFGGPEDHTASIDYHLQRFFVDTNGNALDPAGDAILRAADAGPNNTHTVVDRADFGDVRTYVVAKGCYPNLDEVSGDPGSGLPIVVSLEYEVKKARSYKVGQPDSAGEQLSVYSTSADDTTQTLYVESDGATTTDDVPLNGTTAVLTETDAGSAITFSSIDALELDAETVGDVIVEDSGGSELARLYGGDLGIPRLASGSRASSIGTSYETFLDDNVTQGGADLAAEIRSSSFSVDNSYEKAGVAGTREQAIHIGQRDVEFSATVAGNFETHENLTDHVQGTEMDVAWNMDGGTVTFPSSVLTGPGEMGPESGEVVSTQDNTFTSEGVNLNAN